MVPRAYCDLHFKPSRQPLAEEIALSHPQILRANVLLDWQGTAYADTAAAHGLEVGGWSWDTKVADFDQDGWQDLYIVNGTWVPNEVSPSNLFFHNMGDGSFREASGEMGLEDYLMTAAATQFDMDGDGDLDLLARLGLPARIADDIRRFVTPGAGCNGIRRWTRWATRC